ncbi:sugar phosphate isomerase/epimerase family protein [Kocuria sp.]|uniref:sugar phosphate isomerase/epimerase family protein n=1 Tax=Kocuria sp. TaxID=1871328 RepID=UPI0026E01421|nr:TIM barrel protein [Kocuria sp.]MDO5618672.1 TIM barrel protein [Kocuria sp.]
MGDPTVEPTARPFGLAPLSVLGLDPVELVHTAANTGFDFVGLRVIPVTDAEPDLNVLPGSARLKAVRRAVHQTGLPVFDVEFLALEATTSRETWLPVVEAGALLGARSVTAAGCDPDRSRLSNTVMELAQDCRDHGLHLNLEPISYQPLNSIAAAAALAVDADCWWLPDTLHLNRFGGDTTELVAHAQRVGMLQLCDGPAQPPASRDALVAESRSHRLPPGAGDFNLRATVATLAPDLPLSVEVPDPQRRAALGHAAWAKLLLESMHRVAAPQTEES